MRTYKLAAILLSLVGNADAFSGRSTTDLFRRRRTSLAAATPEQLLSGAEFVEIELFPHKPMPRAVLVPLRSFKA